MRDAHTHKPCRDAVYNLALAELRSETYPDALQPLSVGIHPWWLTSDWKHDFREVQRWSTRPQVLWIGETGLDKQRGPSFALQEEAFIAHVRLSEQVEKPLIVHCVKAVDELLALKKSLRPKQIWLYHGFRGKTQQMQQLLRAGFHISFGASFHAEALCACPEDFRHAETDDSGLTIDEVLRLQKG
ncbi:MAG: TatD family hydrolase [Bacteroidaceae bacterium]|nr:TatD family hydrolase [Bacteroidaceae bacterium]MCF0186293.1 TatD family hydrolase [Bacteroidaceae bacterium]